MTSDLVWVEVDPAPGARRTWVLYRDGRPFQGELEDFDIV